MAAAFTARSHSPCASIFRGLAGTTPNFSELFSPASMPVNRCANALYNLSQSCLQPDSLPTSNGAYDQLDDMTNWLPQLLDKRGIPSYVYEDYYDATHRVYKSVTEHLDVCLSAASLNFARSQADG
jgi:hypothetical protein